MTLLPSVSPASLAAPIAPGPTPRSYAYDLTLDPAARSLAGRGTIVVTNGQDAPLGELYLRLWPNAPSLAAKGGAATVGAVTVDGVVVQAAVDRTVVKVPLAAPLVRGASATVSFDVAVKVPDRMDRTGTGRDGSLYFGNALPTLAVRDDEGWNLDPYVPAGESFYTLVSDWKVRLRAPEARQLITTGSVASDVVHDGVRELQIVAPQVRDFMVVATTGYELRQQQVDGTNVRVWAPPADARRAEKMLATAADSLGFYNQRYGAYHLPEIDVVAAARLGGGMEYPGVTLNDQNNPDSFLRTVVAHENAHQWYYSMIGNNQYDDPWLDESFASFVTSEFTARTVQQVASDLMRARGLDPRGIGNEGTNVSAPMHDQRSGYYGTVYMRGAKVLDELKQEVGEAAFVSGMREHFATRRHGIATTAAFVETMSKAAGRDLVKWFADRTVLVHEPSADRKLDPNS